MKTLVVHPYDPSTKFLLPIYAEQPSWTVYSNQFGDEGLRQAIESNDRIIMMGHGSPNSLYNRFQSSIIDGSYARLLKTKKLVGIWCYANEFFEHYKLGGPHTGMIISELMEAEHLELSGITAQHILESNPLFAQAMKAAVANEDADFAAIALDIYKTDGSNPVIEYNRQRIFNGIKEVSKHA